jgi:hypothetical protein
VEWIPVEIVFRQKIQSTELTLPLPSFHRPAIIDRDDSRASFTSQRTFRPLPLCRLTC